MSSNLPAGDSANERSLVEQARFGWNKTIAGPWRRCLKSMKGFRMLHWLTSPSPLILSPSFCSVRRRLIRETSGRLTLIGTIEPVADEETDAIKQSYMKVNPESAQWANFGDFNFYQMRVSDSYIIAGFGAMGWLADQPFKPKHD